MKKISNEFKVGLFIVLCLAGLFYLVYSTGKLNFKKDGYYIYARFDEVAGLENKAPVMLNGLEVGKVEGISIDYGQDKTSLILKLWIDAKAKIRSNPVIAIKTLGLMGEKYIQIASNEGEGFIKPETVLDGKPYLDLDALMEEAKGMTEGLVKQLDQLAANLNTTLEGNQDRITQIMKNAEATTKNFEEFSDTIKRNPWKIFWKTKEKPRKK